ncbi:MAG TPA: DUF488 domain-containing protein [Vicinamibacterales bacterium]|nr:DUF488 domain-containing protein [Vicinamibacterales bacterium]
MILTLGHSTRPIEAFLSLLGAHHVAVLGDVRTVPRSRHNPQFDQAALAASLSSAGIEYRHMPALGGLRKPRPDSVNTAWKNASFRGYADYMQTPGFEQALESLIALAADRVVAIMCAEAVPWRCHRSLIADALLARGLAPREIVSEKSTRAHKLTAWARVEHGRVMYPGVI